jgi:amino acid transporter
VGSWLGAWGSFKLLATIMSIGLILVYVMVSTSVPFFFLRTHRAEFSRLRHLVVPLVCVLLLLPPLWGTVWPVLAFPYGLAPYIVMIWIAIGGVYLTRHSQKLVFSADLEAQVGDSFHS